MINNRRNNFAVGLIIVITTAIISFAVSALAFYLFNYLRPSYDISFDSSAVSYSSIKKFNDVHSILNRAYYQDVNQETLLEGAIAGMAASLNDPYTVYFTKEQMAQFMERTEGKYVGIGVTVNLDEDGILSVVECFKGSPAKEAGMLPGDKIIQVEGQDVTTVRDADFIISMIKGIENTKVKLSVYRPSEVRTIDMEVTRRTIELENVTSEMLQDGIGYLKITMFDANVNKYFEDHLNRLISKGMKGLIIDLRDNPGGSYEQVIAIADRLLPEALIVYTEDKYGSKEEKKSDGNQLDIPITVLVNGNSASASEILAGALKDNNRSTLVGTKTFGKGLVQSLVPLEDGSGLKVTIARYFTPSGVCIQGLGIQPDYEVKMNEKYVNMPASEVPRDEDPQFEKALEVIRKTIAKK